jgi:hypothetical protein
MEVHWTKWLECMTFYGGRQTSSLPPFRHDIIFQRNAVTMMLQSSVWGEKYECQEQKSTRKNVQHHWRHMVFFCMPSTSFVGFILFVSESGEIFACGWNFGVEGAGTDPHRRLDFPVSDVAFEHTKGKPTSCGRLYRRRGCPKSPSSLLL